MVVKLRKSCKYRRLDISINFNDFKTYEESKQRGNNLDDLRTGILTTGLDKDVFIAIRNNYRRLKEWYDQIKMLIDYNKKLDNARKKTALKKSSFFTKRTTEE